MPDLEKRPSIPVQVQRELWGRSAGRCEFRGCNECLYKDPVTQQPRNIAHIAHIISWKSTGPRGNPVDSPRLAKDISNLMLTCPIHNNLIDDLKYEEEYPVDRLRKMKKDHEDRILQLSGLGQEYSLRVVELVSKLQDQVPAIDPKDEMDALLPFYPMREKVCIDLCNTESIRDAKRIIDQRVSLHLDGDDQGKSYAVFIMAKIPYSCYLGYAFGDKRKVKTFQHFRDTDDWKWKNGGGHVGIIAPETKKCSDVNLLVNLSGIIAKELIPSYPSYTIQTETPSVYFLQSEEQVVEFRMRYREVLDQIRNIHSEEVKIHLFVAAPNPITFEIGRSIIKNIDPTIILYDKTADDVRYKEIMVLHYRIRDGKKPEGQGVLDNEKDI